MPEFRYPCLSHARSLLPLLRAHLERAALHYSMPASLALDLLPIVEDGLFGYEVLPNRDSTTYLTIGADANGAPVVRESLYCATPPSALRLASVNGQSLLQREVDAWRRIEQRDATCGDWTSAAARIWIALRDAFPDRPRCPIVIHDAGQAALDQSLATAQFHLGDSDPLIDFCGIPDEAQYGFTLKGGRGEYGHLVLRSRGWWELRWTSPTALAHEEWPAMFPPDATGAWACAGEPEGTTPHVPPRVVRDDAGDHAAGRR